MSIERFFSAIKDTAWHSIDELSSQLGLSTSKLTKLSKHLSKHGLIKYQEKGHRIKIQSARSLLLPEEQAETKPILATFIIPPQTSIDLQSTRISNISDVELEVTLRIEGQIREVAIAV